MFSFATPNGFYPVYDLMFSLCAVCGFQWFLFCLSLHLFSEWHIVPQLYIQIKQSRVYSRKALAECKASRRHGKQIRGLYRFLSKPTLQHFFLESSYYAIKLKSGCPRLFILHIRLCLYSHSMKLLLHSVYLIILLSSFYYRRILPVIVHIKPC